MALKYITLETAKLAKEKGFEEETNGYWFVGNTGTNVDTLEWSMISKYHNRSGLCYSAPTQTELQDWLRDTKGLHTEVSPILSSGVVLNYDFTGIVYNFEQGADSCWRHNILKQVTSKTHQNCFEKTLVEALNKVENG